MIGLCVRTTRTLLMGLFLNLDDQLLWYSSQIINHDYFVEFISGIWLSCVGIQYRGPDHSICIHWWESTFWIATTACIGQVLFNHENKKHVNVFNHHEWMYDDTSSFGFPCIFQVGDCMLELGKSSRPSRETKSQRRFTWLKSRRNREVGVARRCFLVTSDDRWPDICWLPWRLCALPLSWELLVGEVIYNSIYLLNENFKFVILYITHVTFCVWLLSRLSSSCAQMRRLSSLNYSFHTEGLKKKENLKPKTIPLKISTRTIQLNLLSKFNTALCIFLTSISAIWAQTRKRM